jgi:hypothetical protein
MRTRWAVLMVAIVVCCAGSAFASGPQIGIGDPTCPGTGPYTQFLTIPPDSFTIHPNSSGGGYFGICNQTGTTWHTIDLFGSTPTSFLPNCYFIGTPTEFTSCVVNGTTASFDIHLSGGTGLSSFCGGTDRNQDRNSQGDDDSPSGCLLIIDLNNTQNSTDPNEAGGFNTLTGTVNAPEPAAFVLFGTGLLGVWEYRRRK